MFHVEHSASLPSASSPKKKGALVSANSLEIEEKYGNFERKPFASGAMKQVVVCRCQV